MIQIETTSHDPFFNQAFEDYVFRTYREGDVLLLWRNRPAVVVGCYQNICREVHMRALLDRGIPVVRRMSGGGTVYHDLGNLNYTLISDQTGPLDYDRCLEPVIRALNALGVPAQKNRTCDIAVDGKKISGSAQKIAGGRVLHHGTLLFDSDLSLLDEITTGRKNDAFCSKGTESAICTVTNLRPLSQGRLRDRHVRKDGWRSSCCRPARSSIRLTEPQLAEVRQACGWRLIMRGTGRGARPRPLRMKRVPNLPGKPIFVRYEARHGLLRSAEVRSDALDAQAAERYAERRRGLTQRCFWTSAGRLRANRRKNYWIV